MRTTTASRTGFFACKRAVDVTASALCLLLLAPLLLLVAAAVKLGSPGPVLFRQERLGKGSRPFLMAKFRTMVLDAHRNGPLVTTAGDARVTPLGRLLRMTKLDELPQLWHVLVGDMSLVGPRPQTRQYFELYRDEYSRILEVVRPGITDYAAICYRNEEAVLAQFEEEPETAYIRWVIPAKLRLYRLYVDRMSIRTDLYILMHTIRALVAPGRSPSALGSSVELGVVSSGGLSPAGRLGPDVM
jgi:lipopolysaccharide/colanic/teichoic acid biosynthesis glycosyltransferase